MTFKSLSIIFTWQNKVHALLNMVCKPFRISCKLLNMASKFLCTLGIICLSSLISCHISIFFCSADMRNHFPPQDLCKCCSLCVECLSFHAYTPWLTPTDLSGINLNVTSLKWLFCHFAYSKSVLHCYSSSQYFQVGVYCFLYPSPNDRLLDYKFHGHGDILCCIYLCIFNPYLIPGMYQLLITNKYS